MSSSFVHLHNHTEYSMLDGAAKVDELARLAAEMRMPAIATTDHGYLFGAFDFWNAVTKAGVKPIIGIEGYVTPQTHRTTRTRAYFGGGGRDDVSSNGSYTHMTLWSENTEGMHNLFRLCSRASIEGSALNAKYPRMDRELLQTYGKGLIGTTGCPSGEVQTFLHFGKYKEALKTAADFRDILGEGNYYVELMDHGLDIERRVRNDLLRLAKDLNLPLVATNDLHYTHAEDSVAQEALLCINSGSTLSDPDRFKFDSNEFYLKSPEQMRDLFRDVPEACDNTLAIAERCEVAFAPEVGKYMPHFPVPAGETEESWLIKEVERGLHVRYPQGIPDESRKQAEYEVGVITRMGFAGYFLIVSDYIKWAKEQGIRVGPGRGSGAGSMVAYATRITDLDPIKHSLIFERFLNPDRVSLPDFDVDFDDRRRGEVIDYVTRKYGDDRVAQIATFGTIKAKQAVKDSVRVLGHPFALGEKITKTFPPPIMGKDISLAVLDDPEDKRYDETHDLRDVVANDPDAGRVMELAKGLEGLKRQWGVHAAGVIMSSEPLMDVIPIMLRRSDNHIITQFEYPACEEIGMVKMDFLGLRNLTILEDARLNIERNDKEPPAIIDAGLDDEKTFETLRQGRTLGVFQLDGGPMRSLLRQMKPDHFEDISAVLALYRPGPMGANSHINYAMRKNGLQEINPIHPELKEPLADILDTTYGLIVYQEQVMQIAQKVAGYSLGQADILRRAMGKKKKEVLDREYVSFREGMMKNGYSEDAVEALWAVLLPFSDYAFNKAHTAAYGLIAYWTAYYKTHFPSEYMAAVLTSVGDNKDTLATYLNEVREMGLKVLPPDVNYSRGVFQATADDTIRFGLNAVKNVGADAVSQIVREREENGEYEDMFDFIERLPTKVASKSLVEALIKAGAFDYTGQTRQGLMLIHEDAIAQVSSGKKIEEKTGQVSLFGDSPEMTRGMRPEVPTIEWERDLKLAIEREFLGLYISGHPLDGMDDVLERYRNATVSDALEADDTKVPENPWQGPDIFLTGLVKEVDQRRTKNGDHMGSMVLEDRTGGIECVAFPKVYEAVKEYMVRDTVVSVKGKVSIDKERDKTSVFVREVMLLN